MNHGNEILMGRYREQTCCPEGGKLILHHCCHLCAQECWGPWSDENQHGFILYVCPREKKCLVNEFLKAWFVPSASYVNPNVRTADLLTQCLEVVEG